MTFKQYEPPPALTGIDDSRECAPAPRQANPEGTEGGTARVEHNEELQRDEKRGRNKKRATRSCRTRSQSCQSHTTTLEGAYTRHCSAARNGVDVARNPPSTSRRGGRTRCATPPAWRRMGVDEHVAVRTVSQPKLFSAVEPELGVQRGAVQR